MVWPGQVLAGPTVRWHPCRLVLYCRLHALKEWFGAVVGSGYCILRLPPATSSEEPVAQRQLLSVNFGCLRVS